LDDFTFDQFKEQGHKVNNSSVLIAKCEKQKLPPIPVTRRCRRVRQLFSNFADFFTCAEPSFQGPVISN
jgi:hypothetical protein